MIWSWLPFFSITCLLLMLIIEIYIFFTIMLLVQLFARCSDVQQLMASNSEVTTNSLKLYDIPRNSPKAIIWWSFLSSWTEFFFVTDFIILCSGKNKLKEKCFSSSVSKQLYKYMTLTVTENRYFCFAFFMFW